MARLDKIMVMDDWEARFLRSLVQAILRPTSGYIPICLFSGEDRDRSKRHFQFEKWQFKQPEVVDII